MKRPKPPMNTRAVEVGARAILPQLITRDISDEDNLEARRRVAAAVIAAYEAQRAAEGLVVVPKEPTQAMIEAGCDNNPTSWNEGTDLGFAADVANDIYRAMIAAAQEQNDAGE